MRLINNHVLVTGGAQGIGAAIVTDCLLEGARVSFIDINVELSQVLVNRLTSEGHQVQFETGDVSKFDSFQAACAKLVAKYGPVTAAVSNAGRNSYADPVEYAEEEWESFFALDLKSSWYIAKLCLPEMRKNKKGSIVNISSIHGRMTSPNFFPYSAAKSGIIGLTRNLALDEAKHGIRFNSVSPGYIQTPLQDSYFKLFPQAKTTAIEFQPMKRMGQPSEVAKVVSFVLSDEASFVNGADLMVDCGLHARYAS
jgi:NAD(P)-dependent dehydrogenase (short-subunit alcohol dehydrogenase family)